MTAPTAPRTPPATPSGSFLTRKLGPLPTWAWMALAVAGAVVYSMYQRNKAPSSSGSSSATPPDQTPPQVFQTMVTVPETINVNDSDTIQTPPPQPPGTGRPGPPGGEPSPPPPAPHGPTPAPHGEYVTVAKWNSHNAPWNSTLWGIAANKLGNGQSWPRIWNDPRNASLKSRRKDPKLIQPGDKVWVSK